MFVSQEYRTSPLLFSSHYAEKKVSPYAQRKGFKYSSYNITKYDIHCILSGKNKRCVSVNKKIYCSLHKLIDECPEIKRKENLNVLAKITNFIINGLDYKVIDKPNHFINKYNKIISENKISTITHRISDCGIYNLNKITTPKICNKTFTFYVKDNMCRPYKVTCPFPFPVNVKEKSKCQLLPTNF